MKRGTGQIGAGMLSNSEKAILEIGTGAWFLTAVSLVLVFGFYCLRCAVAGAWRNDPTVQAAFALAIFGLGSAMRALLAWYRFATGDYSGAEFILTWWPLFEVSIFANAIGAVIAVYALSPSYRWCLSIGVVIASFAIPGIIYLT
jgi:hypothetical protein